LLIILKTGGVCKQNFEVEDKFFENLPIKTDISALQPRFIAKDRDFYGRNGAVLAQKGAALAKKVSVLAKNFPTATTVFTTPAHKITVFKRILSITLQTPPRSADKQQYGRRITDKG
jgi:hypothetical protein